MIVKIISVALIIYGAGGIIQSFAKHDTMDAIRQAGRDPSSLKSTLWFSRMIGVIALSLGVYLLVGNPFA